jgi:sterol desaturase/sphingolipid hydroxylase (fatty acid hydroxylase superfamily)
MAWILVLGLGSLAAWLGYVGAGALSAAGDLTQAIAAARDHSAGPVLIGFVAFILVAERIWPSVPRPLLARAHLVDATYLVLSAVVVLPLLALVQTGLAVEVTSHAGFLLVSRLSLVPQIVVIGVILAGIDAANWAAHVANHRSLALWRLHALHHSQVDMSVLTTFRTHPLVHASYLPALFPVLILGASGTVPGAALIVYGCLVTLPHANLRWTFGPFGRIFVSPAYHRLHHVLEPIDSRGTVNFGFVLVCWDQLFRLAAYPSGGTAAATGIPGAPVPLEQAASLAGTPRVVLAQLAQPFHVHAATDGAA